MGLGTTDSAVFLIYIYMLKITRWEGIEKWLTCKPLTVKCVIIFFNSMKHCTSSMHFVEFFTLNKVKMNSHKNRNRAYSNKKGRTRNKTVRQYKYNISIVISEYTYRDRVLVKWQNKSFDSFRMCSIWVGKRRFGSSAASKLRFRTVDFIYRSISNIVRHFIFKSKR